MDTITFEDWKKIEMRTGKIISAERIEGTDKLYKIQVNVGEEKPRQIVSGIVPSYTQEELVGQNIIVLTNLATAVIRGVESQGMLLCATKDGICRLLTTPADVAPGTPVK